jgi:sulfate permease
MGVAKLGFRNIFRKTEVNKFFAMWIISPVAAFLLSFAMTFIAAKAGWI